MTEVAADGASIDPAVREVVDQLAAAGRRRFRASWVADQSGVEARRAQDQLTALVSSGELTMNFEVLCPEDGRTIASFRAGEPIPVGKFLDAPDCPSGPVEVVEEELWVTFTPTDKLLLDVNARLAPDRKKKPRRRSRRLKTASTPSVRTLPSRIRRWLVRRARPDSRSSTSSPAAR
jgi:hypothetical protein